MKKQSYSNHRRNIPALHIVLFLLIACTFIGSMVNLMDSLYDEERIYSSSLLVAVSTILMVAFFVFRKSVLRAQDRAIKAEENLRHYMMTGVSLDSRLRTSQIVALRFAPDDEFVALAKDAADRQLSSEEIKKSIRRWKGDYHSA